jgi:hypothetical protein
MNKSRLLRLFTRLQMKLNSKARYTTKDSELQLRNRYYVVGHYPSSCLYLKSPSCLFFKTQRFGDWILSPSSGETYSGTSSVDWAQMSRFYLKTETESSLRNVVFWKINRTLFLDKDRTMDNVQQHSICTNVPLSQTVTSYLQMRKVGSPRNMHWVAISE